MPTDMSKYPADWPQIRNRILRRAGGREDDPRIGARCEKCGVRNYAIGQRAGGKFVRAVGNIYYDDYQYATSYRGARETAEFLNEEREAGEPRYVVIVLTIAHVHDPDPANCTDDNLAAWCQRCHNRHDVRMRKRNAAKTRRGKLVEAGQGVLL